MKTHLLLLLLVGVCRASPVSHSPGETQTTQKKAAVSKLPQVPLPDFRQPKTAAEVVSQFALRPALLAALEFASNFPYDAVEKIKKHRYLQLDRLQAPSRSGTKGAAPLTSVVSLPYEEIAAIDDFLSGFTEELAQFASRSADGFMLAVRELLAHRYPALAWVRPLGGLAFFSR